MRSISFPVTELVDELLLLDVTEELETLDPLDCDGAAGSGGGCLFSTLPPGGAEGAAGRCGFAIEETAPEFPMDPILIVAKSLWLKR